MRRELRRWLRALDRAEAKLRIRYGRQRNLFVAMSATIYEKDQSTPARLLEDFRRGLRVILAEHYTMVVREFGNTALEGLKSRRATTMELKDSFQTFMREWVATQALKKATTIAATDMDAVRDAINDGIEEGE